jgi:hypothetical protein
MELDAERSSDGHALDKEWAFGRWSELNKTILRITPA